MTKRETGFQKTRTFHYTGKEELTKLQNQATRRIPDLRHLSYISLEPTPKNVCILPASEQLLLAELDNTYEKDYEVQKILASKYEDGWLRYRVR